MSDEETALKLAEFLPYRLSIASNAVSNRIAEVYRTDFGLKVTEWRIMAVLADAGSLTQRELTARTLMDKVAVNRAARALESRGLLSRKPNASDGRSHHLKLTDEGRDIHTRVMPQVSKMEERLFSEFDPRERALFTGLLERLHERAAKLDPEAGTNGSGTG